MKGHVSFAGGLYEHDNWQEKPRTKLAFLSKNNPDVLDAQFTKCSPGQCTKEAEEAIEKVFAKCFGVSHLLHGGRAFRVGLRPVES